MTVRRGPNLIVVILGALVSFALGGACAQTQEAKDPPVVAAAVAPPSDDDDDDDEPDLPRSLDEAARLLEFTCPAPVHRYDAPARAEAGGEVLVLHGSEAVREGSSAESGLNIGVLGALKDASDQTRANVQKAAELFKERGVKLVLANGDLGEDSNLEDVFRMLGESFDVPVVAHAGNMEWTSAFTKAWSAAHKDHPHLVNGNWLEHIALGDDLHLLVLPGYFNLRFLGSGACRYTDDELARLRARAESLVAEGGTVALVSHGPPLGKGDAALDVAYDDAGNVGDPRVTALVKETGIRFGLFSHILESGGRACADAACETPLALPLKKPVERLFVNVGSASGYGWQLLDGTQSSGLSMVVNLSAAGATAELIRFK